jgi:hypothetical protein
MPRKKDAPASVVDPQPETTEVVTDSISPLPREAPDAEGAEKLKQFYTGYDESQAIELHRVEPPEFEGVAIKGYTGELRPGCMFPYIQRMYGGGRYQVIVRDRAKGTFLGSCYIQVSGLPRIAPVREPAAPLASDVEPDAPAISGEVPTVDIEGVRFPLTGNFQKWQDFLIFAKGAKYILKEPPDPNYEMISTLLAAIIGHKKEDPLDLILRLRQSLPEVFEGGGGSDGSLVGLLTEAVKQAGALGRLTGGGHPGGVAPGPRAGRFPAQRPVAERTLPAQTTEKPEPEAVPEQEGKPMGIREIGMGAVAEIVKGYFCEPRQTPEIVVDSLQFGIELSESDRQQIVPFRPVLWAWAERMIGDDLPEDVKEAAKEKAEFKAYFDRVFDGFVNPQPKQE